MSLNQVVFTRTFSDKDWKAAQTSERKQSRIISLPMLHEIMGLELPHEFVPMEVSATHKAEYDIKSNGETSIRYSDPVVQAVQSALESSVIQSYRTYQNANNVYLDDAGLSNTKEKLIEENSSISKEIKAFESYFSQYCEEKKIDRKRVSYIVPTIKDITLVSNLSDIAKKNTIKLLSGFVKTENPPILSMRLAQLKELAKEKPSEDVEI